MYVASASVRVPWVVIDSQCVLRRNKAMSKRIKWGLEKIVFFFISSHSLTHMTWGINNKMLSVLMMLLLLQI